MKRAQLWLLSGGAVCLLGAYLFLAYGPLRWGWDGAEYLAMAAVRADGFPFPHTRLPIGYPACVVLLERVGLANQCGFVLANVFGLAVGLVAFFTLARKTLGLSAVETLAICLLSSLYRITAELAEVPQPDLLYFGASMLAVLCLWNATSKTVWLVPGLAFCAAAVALRSIGLALIPVTAFAVWHSRHKVVAAAGSLVTWVAILATLVKWRGYVANTAAPTYRGQGIASVLWFDVTYRFEELADLATNTHFPLWHSLQLIAWISVLTVVLTVCIVAGWWKSRQSPLAIYFGAYLAILMVWPALMPRFWAPITPIAFAFAWAAFQLAAARFEGAPRVPKAALACWAIWFAALGIYGFDRQYAGAGESARNVLVKLAKEPYLSTSEIARLNPPDLALMPNRELMVHRYGGQK